MAFTLPPLPYKLTELEPHISGRTLEFHRTKHHQGYLDNLNNLIQDTPLAQKSLEDVIQEVANNPASKGIFNNAAQVWNHTFYWSSMKPQGGGELKEGPLKKLIVQKFGSVDAFKAEFKKASLAQFGSGWSWLVVNTEGNLEIVTTGNADLPLIHHQHSLLTCDVWEHAYYLDYQNRRPDYVQIFLDHLVNWDFAEQQLVTEKGC